MDILNFISWIRGRRQVTSVDPAKTLIPVGLKDGRRDDEYLTGAISVEDLASQIAPQPSYKVYTALLTQSGTDAPVATVLENTLGDLTFEYGYQGNYYVNSLNLFINNKTSVTITSIGASVPDGFVLLNAVRQSDNQLQIVARNIIPPFAGLVNDGFLSQGNLIEIRVYN